MGVAGSVRVGPPGVTVGAGVVGVAVNVMAVSVMAMNWVGVDGRAVAVPVMGLGAATKAKNPTQ